MKFAVLSFCKGIKEKANYPNGNILNQKTAKNQYK